MSDAFYEATGGAYRIEISPIELLGSQKDAFELVQSGTIQMAMVANSIVENVNPDFAVLGLPYAYDSVEHQKNGIYQRSPGRYLCKYRSQQFQRYGGIYSRSALHLYR